LSVLNCPHSGVEAPTAGDKTATLARSSARAKVATAQAAGPGVRQRPGVARPPAAAKRPSRGGRATPPPHSTPHAGGRMAKGADGESATSPPRPRAGKCSTPMIERRPPGWLRPTAAEPTSERAVLAARRSRFEATAAGLASATVLARSTVRIALAKPDDVGLIRRRTGWRGGPVPARPTARPWPPSRATPNRPTGEPATPCRAAAGRPARRPCARLMRRISPHGWTPPTPSCVADRGQAQKSHRTAPGIERRFNRRS
jgi:hypothetical protein